MFHYVFLLLTGVDPVKNVTGGVPRGWPPCSNEEVWSVIAIKWHSLLFCLLWCHPLYWVLPFLPGVPSRSPRTKKLMNTSEVIRDYQKLEVTSVFAGHSENAVHSESPPLQSLSQACLSHPLHSENKFYTGDVIYARLIQSSSIYRTNCESSVAPKMINKFNILLMLILEIY